MWFSLQSSIRKSKTLYQFFKCSHDIVARLRASWSPSSVIVDNAQAGINTLRCFLASYIGHVFHYVIYAFRILIVSCTCKIMWPDVKIFLCLWHVWKAWPENAIKIISIVGERAVVLHIVGNIMYGKGCDINDDPIDWAP